MTTLPLSAAFLLSASCVLLTISALVWVVVVSAPIPVTPRQAEYLRRERIFVGVKS